MQRRNFLKATGAAGAGLLATTGTASAWSYDPDNPDDEPFPFEMSLQERQTFGDIDGKRVPHIRLMLPALHDDLDEYWPEYEDLNARREAEIKHAANVFEDLVNKSSYLDGLVAEHYKYNYSWFAERGEYTNDSWEDAHPCIFEPELGLLSEALRSYGADDGYVYVWDVGEIHQNECDDWPGEPGSEHHDMALTDEALTSDRYYPNHPGSESADTDWLLHDYAHVRVRIAPYTLGRLTSGALHALIRQRDDGAWGSSDTPPGTDIYPTDYDWELADLTYVGESSQGSPIYKASGTGRVTISALDHIADSSFCVGDQPEGSAADGDWISTDELADHVTYCTSDMVSQACKYFNDKYDDRTGNGSTPYEFPCTREIQTSVGDGDGWTEFAFMVPNDAPYDWQDELDHAKAVMQDIITKTGLESEWYVRLIVYTYDPQWFEDYGGDADMQPRLHVLDDAVESGEIWGYNSFTFIWDLGDVAQYATDDWPNHYEHNEIPGTDPAASSSEYCPSYVSDFDTNRNEDYDLQGRYAPHIRVANYPHERGRLSAAMVHSMIRQRSDGDYWESSDTPPGQSVANPDYDYQVAKVEDTGRTTYDGTNIVRPTAAGSNWQPVLEDIVEGGVCGGDSISGDYEGVDPSVGTKPEVTQCTADMIRETMEYFGYGN